MRNDVSIEHHLSHPSLQISNFESSRLVKFKGFSLFKGNRREPLFKREGRRGRRRRREKKRERERERERKEREGEKERERGRSEREREKQMI